MSRIALYTRSGHNHLFPKVGLRMEKQGHDITYVVQNNREAKIVESYGVQGPIYDLTAYIRRYWNDREKLDRHTIDDVEAIYEIDSIWSVFYTDRFLIKYKREDAERFIKLHVTFLEDLIAERNCEFFINEAPAIFAAYLFLIMGEKLNCRYLGLARGRNFTSEKFFFTRDPYCANYRLNKIYNNGDLNENDLKQARDFIDRFRASGTKPGYMKQHGRKPQISISWLIDFMKYAASFRDRMDKYDYEKWRERKNIYLWPMRNYFKYQKQKRYYRNPRDGEKFYLFPLHFQPESSTLVWAPNYEKQLYAIDLIAKKLPGDVSLYVKEHYAHLGHRENGFYQELRNYPTVRLINPWVDSHELIKKSLGVITLTGTAGWEALLYGRPVYLLGRVFYESFKYIYRIDSIDELTHIIRASQNGDGPAEDYDDELVRYVAAYLKSFRDGNYSLTDPTVTENSNVEKLCENILAEVENLCDQ